jgi:hypothetical protein
MVCSPNELSAYNFILTTSQLNFDVAIYQKNSGYTESGYEAIWNYLVHQEMR